MISKRLIASLIISAIFTGLGMIITKEYKKAFLLFIVSAIITYLAYTYSLYFHIISFVIWIIGMYLTYQSVKDYEVVIVRS